ncbi:putative disease resistance protein RGA3 [Chenopodium quinoa]|uniref:putative disease resistance protein RGA3 n=1 Tax=Chenopodium quinoa TaxID=63459 RepID=UPI000B77E5E0|nr:putative disease resistance protein RGA3 [Chenopodium quinoa]
MKNLAADEVVWNNLSRILEVELVINAMKPLEELKKSVKAAKITMAAVQESDDTNSNMLKNLGDLLYQADDLLDEILTFKQNTGSGFSRKAGLLFSCHNPLFYPNRLGEQVKRISQKIGELTKQLHYEPEPEPGLQGQSTSEPEHQPQTAQNETEHTQEFKLAENKVIGRESDKEKIIKMLLRPKTEFTNDVSVIPIHGAPGVGKSTLAKYVYDDKKVSSHFDLKIWIRVSGLTDEAEIVREIVKSCTNWSNDNRSSKLTNIPHSRFYDLLGCQNDDRSAIPPNDSNSNNEKDISKRRLQKEIEGKLYLLILDDVEVSIKKWDDLKKLLAGGARGSHILATTRFKEIAKLSKSEGVEYYELEGLQKKDCWSLLKTFAFGNTDSPGKSNAFNHIGEQIAHDKCKGVPLTIKVAASLLGKTIEDWVSFNDQIPNNLKEKKDIMNHILEKSYTALPAHLKACFDYCSLFPDDFNFNKHDLISLWTAQGYVIHQQVNPGLEDVAEKYFLELSRRCFFEDVSTNDLGHILTCKMHRIMRDLAHQHTAGVLDTYVKDSRAKQVPDSACKHDSFTPVGDSPTKIAPSLVQARNLRTLISVKETDCDTKMGPLVCDRLISRLKCLRVLDFHDLGIEELPVSIGKLIHLRYLDLSKNGLITLPKSITELYNLQTLKLNSCLRLKRLSRNFGKLVNLRRFEIDECDSLASMPTGLEKLTQLQTLSRFVVSKDCSTELEVLNKLVNLKGRLEIELSGDWETNIPESQKTKWQIKNHLEELKISWAKTASKNTSYLQLLEQLQPTSKLRILRIEGYKGGHFPDWLKKSMLSCLSDLEVISIEGCDQCKHLPPFGKLQSLRKLTLRHMANVEYVEGPQEDGSKSFFPRLEELTLHNFYNLEQWRKDELMVPGKDQTRSFTRLKKLKMWNCPKMISMPLFEKVVDLELRNINQMLLQELAKASTKKSIINNLQIKECHNLESFSVVRKGLGGLPVLNELVVERCNALHLLASELKYLTSLNRLEISSCKNLNFSNNDITKSSDSNTIIWISSKIVHLDELSRNPWKSLKCLHHLNLREIPKMETLPEGLKHVTSLRSLWISACPALKALPEWIGSLTALQHLRIENCKSLKTLPDGIKDVQSLIKVEISECPELMKRCKEHTGEDWHKIKHAQVLLRKSWRYGLMSEQGAQQNRSNVRAITDVKYFIVPVIAAEAVV